MGSFTLVLKTLTTIMAILVRLSPAPAIYQVHKTKQIQHLSELPIASMVGASQVWMLYGYCADDWFPLFATFLFGDIVSALYLAVYFNNTTERPYVLKCALWVVALIVISTAYVALAANDIVSDKRTAKKVFGYLGVVSGLILYASPFETMVQVVRSKNAISIPILMVSVGAVSNALWVLYGFVISDWFVALPNCATTAFGVMQIILYVVYNPKNALDQRLTVVLSPVDGKMATQWGTGEEPHATGANVFRLRSSFDRLACLPYRKCYLTRLDLHLYVVVRLHQSSLQCCGGDCQDAGLPCSRQQQL